MDTGVFLNDDIEVLNGISVFTVGISSDNPLRVEPRFSYCPACSPITLLALILRFFGGVRFQDPLGKGENPR